MGIHIRRAAFFLFTAVHLGNAASYYISSSTGDDSRTPAQAQDSASPWQSLEKVNAESFNPGDQILFKRGDTWAGQLSITSSGTASLNIVFAPYGEGEAPVIEGGQVLSGWIPYQGQIYAANAPQSISQLFFDGESMQLARHPNRGYLTINRIDDSVTFTDSTLSLTPNWTGATAHIRSMQWTLSSKRVSAFNAAEKTYRLEEMPIYGLKLGWGYFLNNKLEALDSPGEWYYDSTSGKVYLWPPAGGDPGNHLILGTAYQTGIALHSASHVTVRGFTIAYHALRGIEVSGSTAVTLQNNTVLYADGIGIQMSGPSSAAAPSNIQDNTVHGSNSYGMVVSTGYTNITGNIVTNTGILTRLNATGMGDQCCSGRGINTSGSGNIIRSNTLDSSGYIGLGFSGRDNLIEYNYINNSCLTTDDCAGIYTWNTAYADPGSMGSVIRRNIVVNSRSAPAGTGSSSYTPGEGIYLDDRTHHVKVLDNTVAHCANLGIFLHNTQNVEVRGNIVYGNTNAQMRLAEDDKSIDGSMRDNIIKDNIFYSLSETQVTMRHSSSELNPVLAASDSNTYANPYSPMVISAFSENFTLSGWQTSTGQDAHSRTSPYTWLPLAVTDTVSANLVTNGTFDENIISWNSWPGDVELQWAQTPPLDGGCLRTLYVGDPNLNPYAGTNAFTVSQGLQYLIRFSVVSDKPGTISPIVRQGDSPYASLGFNTRLPMEASRLDYAFIFTATQNYANARIHFHNSPADSLYWLDNVSLHQVTAVKEDPKKRARLIMNPSLIDITADLGSSTLKDIYGNTLPSSVVLQPFTSIIAVNDDPSAILQNQQHVLRQEKAPEIHVSAIPGSSVIRFIWPADYRLKSLTLYSLSGRTAGNIGFQAGHHVDWDARNMPGGVYTLTAQLENMGAAYGVRRSLVVGK